MSLTSGKPVSLTDLGVTPQTVFISPRTVGVDAKSDEKRLRSHLPQGDSRRTSIASRSTRGTTDNPLEEVRKRLIHMEPPSRGSETPPLDITPTSGTAVEPSVIDSRASSLDVTSTGRSARRRVEGKAAPAVTSINATAAGVITVHDDASLGILTPTEAQGSGPTRSTPYASSYEGHDPALRAFLEQIDLDNYREPLLNFGSRISGSQRKRPQRGKPGKPQTVTMIAHLTQHSASVRWLISSPDHIFFASAAEDGLVLIWDTARLERSVSAKARLVHRMHAPITAMCRIENTHCLAVAAEDGELHVIRIHVGISGGSARYGKVELLRMWRTDDDEGHVIHVSQLTGKLIAWV